MAVRIAFSRSFREMGMMTKQRNNDFGSLSMSEREEEQVVCNLIR